CNLQYFSSFFYWHFHFLSNFFWSWLSTKLLYKIARGSYEFIDCFDHVNRNTDRSCLVSNCASDRLTDPPCCVCREFVTSSIFEFINSFHQTDVTLLDEIQELETTVCVLLSDRNHESEVCFDEFRFRLISFSFTFPDCSVSILQPFVIHFSFR